MASVMVALVVAYVAVLLAVPTKPAAAAFPGKNGDIAFSAEPISDGTSQIFSIQPDGTRMKALTQVKGDGYVGVPVWSPNGKKIAYARESNDFTYDSEIYLMNARDGSSKVNLTKSPNRYEGGPSFYPSGRRIIFNASSVDDAGNYHGSAELYSLSFDESGNATGPPKRLTNNSYPDISPTVSADGKKIAFVSARDENADLFGDREIYVMNAAPERSNNQPVQLTDNGHRASGEPINDESPDFSPDGRRIVYHSNATGDSEIMVMSAKDGSGKKNLSNNPARDSAPAFSPDGNMIAFASSRDGDGEIWKMRADGTRPTHVTKNTTHYDSSPDWQPLP